MFRWRAIGTASRRCLDRGSVKNGFGCSRTRGAQTPRVRCKARKFLTRVRKYLTRAEKSLAKFDVNSCLHVESWPMHDLPAFGLNLQAPDRVERVESLISFPFQLPCFRRILPCIDADHVKHASERVMLERDHVKPECSRVKLSPELPRSDATEL